MSEPTDLRTEETAGKQIQLEEVYPIMQEVLAAGGTFTLTVTGTSMYPTILGWRDRVSLTAAPAKLHRLDLPLYRRRSGQFVLHRIVSVEQDGSYTCCGDHQWVLEPGIRHEQIVGLVTSIERKGKRFSVDSKRYRFWVKLWEFLRPIRHFLFRVFGKLHRIFQRLFKRKK